MKRIILLALVVCLAGCGGSKESKERIADRVEYPQFVNIPNSRSAPNEKHYLLEMSKKGDVVYALNKVVYLKSDFEDEYSRTETNCKTMQMREIGTGSGSANNIKNAPTDWFELSNGSTKSDLANFVCK